VQELAADSLELRHEIEKVEDFVLSLAAGNLVLALVCCKLVQESALAVKQVKMVERPEILDQVSVLVGERSVSDRTAETGSQ
jgi:hypothetical protein